MARYIVMLINTSMSDKYIWRTFPRLEFTNNENYALKMYPEDVTKVSKRLMEMGCSHAIIQKSFEL